MSRIAIFNGSRSLLMHASVMLLPVFLSLERLPSTAVAAAMETWESLRTTVLVDLTMVALHIAF